MYTKVRTTKSEPVKHNHWKINQTEHHLHECICDIAQERNRTTDKFPLESWRFLVQLFGPAVDVFAVCDDRLSHKK